MEVRFTDDELVEAVTLLVNRMADEAGVSDKDRAMLKRWRAKSMKIGAEDFDDVVRKANEDFARMMQRRERSQIRKPDWVD
jgi:hypothetical protein